MDYKHAAQQVLDAIGGASNIVSAAHCATRLRLVIADNDKVDKKALENAEGAKGVFEAQGQLQIIFGTGTVNKVYDEFTALAGIGAATKEEVKQAAAAKAPWYQQAIKTLGDIFVPIIPAIVASGFLMGIMEALNFMVNNGFVNIDTSGSLYVFAQLFSNTAYTFLPILIAFSAAKVFGGNPFLGAVIGMIMIHPNLQNAWTVASEGVQTYQPVFGGLYSIPLVGYQGHVIPVIIAVWLMSQIEKRLHKVVPAMFDLFVTPLVSVFVTGYLTLAVIGPIFTTVEDGIINGVQALIQLPYGIGSFVMGGLYAITVVAGIHHMYTLIDVGQLAKFGYTYWLPLASAANVAQGGAALAVALKSKNAKVKSMALPSALSACMGITEPAIFGVNLRLRWPFFCAMAAAAIGSAGVALLNVRGQALGAAGFVGFVSIVPKSIPAYLALEVLVFVLSFGFTFAYAMTRGKADMEGRAPAKKEAVVAAAVAAPAGGAAPAAAPAPVPSFSDEAKADLSVSSPLAGTVVPLEQVKDESFAKGMLGPGIGIEPADGLVVAPFDGKVTVAFPTGHAYGLKSASGVQVLIHVGMDTVKLDGKGFTPRVAKGDIVRRGDVLAEVDLDVIRAAGYETITPVVVTNKKKFGAVTPVASGEIQRGDALLDVAPKEA